MVRDTITILFLFLNTVGQEHSLRITEPTSTERALPDETNPAPGTNSTSTPVETMKVKNDEALMRQHPKFLEERSKEEKGKSEVELQEKHEKAAPEPSTTKLDPSSTRSPSTSVTTDDSLAHFQDAQLADGGEGKVIPTQSIYPHQKCTPEVYQETGVPNAMNTFSFFFKGNEGLFLRRGAALLLTFPPHFNVSSASLKTKLVFCYDPSFVLNCNPEPLKARVEGQEISITHNGETETGAGNMHLPAHSSATPTRSESTTRIPEYTEHSDAIQGAASLSPSSSFDYTSVIWLEIKSVRNPPRAGLTGPFKISIISSSNSSSVHQEFTIPCVSILKYENGEEPEEVCFHKSFEDGGRDATGGGDMDEGHERRNSSDEGDDRDKN